MRTFIGRHSYERYLTCLPRNFRVGLARFGHEIGDPAGSLIYRSNCLGDAIRRRSLIVLLRGSSAQHLKTDASMPKYSANEAIKHNFWFRYLGQTLVPRSILG